MKNFLILAFMCIMSSCTLTPVKPPAIDPVIIESAPVATEVMKPVPSVPAEPVKVDEWIVKVNVKSLTGFNETQSARFKKIAANVQTIINTKEFKDAVLNHSYLGKKQFISTTDSNEKVLQKILSKDWSLIYRLEYIAKKPFVALTVGYTYPSVDWIVINSKIFNTMGDEEIAANIVHEYGGHKFGRYDHDSKWNKARDYSTPYGLGSIAEKIYLKKFK